MSYILSALPACLSFTNLLDIYGVVFNQKCHVAGFSTIVLSGWQFACFGEAVNPRSVPMRCCFREIWCHKAAAAGKPINYHHKAPRQAAWLVKHPRVPFESQKCTGESSRAWLCSMLVAAFCFFYEVQRLSMDCWEVKPAAELNQIKMSVVLKILFLTQLCIEDKAGLLE